MTTKRKIVEKERLTARLDLLIKPSLKEKLITAAQKDRRELSDFIRLYLETIVK